MISTSNRSFLRRAAAALALMTLGCGLAEYESHMSSEVVRLDRLDREAKFLGEPLRMPPLPKKDDKDQTWPVFLRPPLGFSVAPDRALLGGMLANYAPPAHFKGLYLGVAGDRKEFTKEVFQLFPAATERKGETVAVDPEGTQKVLRYTFDDNLSTVTVNFSPPTNPQVAVVYRVEKGRLTGDVAEAVKLSLGTLGYEGDADRQRFKFNLLKGKPVRR